MKKVISILLASLGSLYCGFLYAEGTQSCHVVDKTTQIYFGNGVNNTIAEARFSRNTLVHAYLTKHDIRQDYPGEKFNFVLYRHSACDRLCPVHCHIQQGAHQKRHRTSYILISVVFNCLSPVTSRSPFPV